jgi:predicted transcriptional regulator
MLKGEIDILDSIALSKCKMKQIINGRIARNNSYVISTVNSLVKRGYIYKSESQEYKLSQKGIQAVLEFSDNYKLLRQTSQSNLLRIHLDRTSEAVKMIESIGVEYSVKLKEIQN